MKARKSYESNEFVSHNITLNPEDYLIEGKKIGNNLRDIDKDFLGLLKEECKNAFMPIDVPVPRGPIFVFGEYFLRKFYTVFDRDRNLIGFSIANHNINNEKRQENFIIKTPYDDVDSEEINLPRENELKSSNKIDNKNDNEFNNLINDKISIEINKGNFNNFIEEKIDELESNNFDFTSIEKRENGFFGNDLHLE